MYLRIKRNFVGTTFQMTIDEENAFHNIKNLNFFASRSEDSKTRTIKTQANPFRGIYTWMTSDNRFQQIEQRIGLDLKLEV